MKLLIVSDIHGDIDSARRILEIYDSKRCDKMLILGDILYFGPRNKLTDSYDPQGVIKLLNERRDIILAVRGNCDAEVDQMVLDFPIMADYCYLSLDGLNIFATHGHIHNTSNPPPLRAGEILLHGHTHVLKCEEFGNNNFYLNPGSPTYPKESNPKTYMLYENRCFTVRSFDGEVILEKKF